MEQNDPILALQDKVLKQYLTEHGINDISAGILFMLIGLGILFFTSAIYATVMYLVMFLAFYKPMYKKYVYPRLGKIGNYPSFWSAPVQPIKFNAKLTFILLAYFIGIVYMVIAFVMKDTSKLPPQYLYANLVIVIVMVILIIGSILPKARLYLYAAMVLLIAACPPIYFGNIPFIVRAILLLLIAVSLLEILVFRKVKLLLKRNIRWGYNTVLFLATGILLFMILTIVHSPFVENVKHLINQFFGTTDDLFITGAILTLLAGGFIMKVTRFIIYAFVISVYLVLSNLIATVKVPLGIAYIGIGLMFSITGYFILTRFIRLNPVLEVTDEG